MWVFMNGRQVKVKRPQMIDGVDIDEYIQQNADPIWLHQNEIWDRLETTESTENEEPSEEELPF